jgi:predicted NAD/FAD-dependent oxidoreductase
MRAAIVGAGISGLAAGRALKQAGWDVRIFESNPIIGGRCETARIDGWTFDSGATSAAPRGGPLEQAITQELDTSDLVEIALPIYIHSGSRTTPGSISKNQTPRYCWASGFDRLPKLLAEGLDIHLESSVKQITESGQKVGLMGEEFDAAIVTCPLPQASALLGPDSSRSIHRSQYRRTLSVMFGFESPFVGPFHALIDPTQTHPMTWLSVETLKCPGARAPGGGTAVVAQMSRRYSKRRFSDSDEKICEETLIDVHRVLGEELGAPAVQAVKRFEFAMADQGTSFQMANPDGSRIVLAGDGVSRPRIESAYQSGLDAAKRVLSL